MKILHVNGADIEGGAARAATRLLQGIQQHEGVDARLYVQRKSGAGRSVYAPSSLFGKAMGRLRPTVEQLVCSIDPAHTNGPFCAAFLPDRLSSVVAEAKPDIVHLHWVARMMRLETLARFNVPIVWTMHDSWAFTGGCYLPPDCTRYRESCGKCPVLGSSREDDLSRRVWQRKRRSWQDLDLTIVAPSRWMASCVQTSSLFKNSRIEVIPNGIDVERYIPCDRRAGREIFGLPQDKKLILFGAKGGTNDRNKGFHLLVEALRELPLRSDRDAIEIVIFGSSAPEAAIDLGFRTHYTGWLHDEVRLASLYAAADVFVFPSLHESLGYAAMEAMACATPCVAFNQGGLTDLVDHRQNGYLARPYEPADLAQGIAWMLEDDLLRKELSAHARKKMESGFDLRKVAERHLSLYGEILNHEP